MPSMITHALFAQEVQDRLQLPLLFEEQSVYLNGAQGPDFLFYHNTHPLYKDYGVKAIRNLGGKVHQKHINRFYKTALNIIQNNPDPILKARQTAYVCGHLCHWALDSTAHPYIYYRVGAGSLPASSRHHRFESLLDAVMLKHKTGLEGSQFDAPAHLIDDSVLAATACASLYVPIVQAVWGQNIQSEWIVHSWKSYRHISALLQDPKGKKYRWISTIEPAFHAEHLLSGLFLPDHCEDNIDVINLRHELWRHPVSGEESTQSFFDLYDLALDKACTAIELFQAALDNPPSAGAFLKFLRNQSYDTGLPVRAQMKYFANPAKMREI